MKTPPATPQLTDRQRVILQSICDDRSNGEIAAILKISPSGIRRTIEVLARKFGCPSRRGSVMGAAFAWQLVVNRTVSISGSGANPQHKAH